MHIHVWDKWQTIGSTEKMLGSAVAYIQKRECQKCGKVQLSRSNMIMTNNLDIRKALDEAIK